MSREIFFKGKSIENGASNGEWEYGYLFDDDIRDSDRRFIGTIVINEIGELEGHAFYEVDPSTVCQYTGLTDITSVRIFENDIVRFAGYSADFRGRVRFGRHSDTGGTGDINYGWFIDFGKDKNYYRQNLGYWINKIIVIGNYFDNPEMLEGGTDE